MSTRQAATCVPVLLLALVAVVGCGGMGRFDVAISLDHRGFQTQLSTIPSVEVNLIGVNASEHPVWYSYSINKYWMPDDPQRVTAVRQGQARVVTFGEQPPFRQVVSRTDRIWDKWKSRKAMHLFVLSNYPRSVDNERAGEADVRRLVLPLNKGRWKGYYWGRRTLRLEVTPSGILNHTPPKPQ